MHCRYCFRRHFPYTEHSVLRHGRHALKTLRDLPDADELILSGGDPLTLSDARLGQLIAEAQKLPQLQRLRIHTRLPVSLIAQLRSIEYTRNMACGTYGVDNGFTIHTGLFSLGGCLCIRWRNLRRHQVNHFLKHQHW